MKRWLVWGVLVVVAGMLAACGGSDDPAHKIAAGDTMAQETFELGSAWEQGVFPPDGEEPASVLALVNGQYQIDHQAERGASFIWGTGDADPVANVIIEVDVEQLSTYDDNLFGVACRLDVRNPDDPSGYALLISGDGHYGIATLKNHSLNFIVEWHQSDTIHTGQSTNHVRAACIDDYFALYVNDEFVGDATNREFWREGEVGLLAGVDGEQAVSVAFDNLVIAAGEFAD